MHAPPELAALQAWMLDQVRGVAHADPARHASRRKSGPRVDAPRAETTILDADSLFTASATMTAAERLGIYQRMYLLRLEEVLGSDYGALRELLGDDAFERLSREYATAHPSRSYTLSHYGHELAPYLRVTHPRRPWMSELAALERAISAAHDAPAPEPEPEPLDMQRLQEVPPAAWEHARLLPMPSLRLMSFTYAIPALYARYLRDQPLRAPRRGIRHLVVVRHGERVLRVPIAEQALAVLSRLANAEPLGAAIQDLADSEAPKLFGWLREWVASGFFQSIQTHP